MDTAVVCQKDKVFKKVINIPLGVKTKLAVQAATMDINLTKYIESILVECADNSEDRWLAQFLTSRTIIYPKRMPT
jgi:hypothetical protein